MLIFLINYSEVKLTILSICSQTSEQEQHDPTVTFTNTAINQMETLLILCDESGFPKDLVGGVLSLHQCSDAQICQTCVWI